MFIKVGTFVLCHLIIPNSGVNTSEDQARKIEQIPGIVKEIIEEDDIQMIDESYAVKKKKYMLLVEPTKSKDKDRIFRIGIDACRPVVEESTHVEITKRKIELKKKKTEESKNIGLKDSAEKKEGSKSLDPVNKAIDSVNELLGSDSEKEDLLKQLE